MSESTDQQNIKRRRIKQACDYCRTKKAKCDGKSPSCTNCISNDIKCVYSQSTKRRGLPTGYTHDLEKKVLLFQGLLSLLIRDDHQLKCKVLNCLINHQSLLDNLSNLQSDWHDGDISQLFNQLINDKNSVLNNVKTSSLSGAAKNGSYDLSSQSEQPSTAPLVHQTPPVVSQQQSPTVPPPPPPPPPPPQDQQAVHEIPQQQNHPSSLQHFNQIVTPGSSSNFYANTPSPVLTDPSFFLNYDVFQFISDEIEGARGAGPENWEPVALQYHGLSSLISGFTNKVVQQYNSKLNNVFKNPFRVGSIFNVSSFAITTSLSSNSFKFPNEIFQFPPNFRQTIDVYFQVHHCYIPMLDKVSFMRHVNYLSVLPEHKRQKVDGNIVALIWAVLSLGEFTKIGGDADVSQIYAKNAIMALENSFITTIESIQAMILLGFTYYNLGQWDFSWVLISSGTRMAIDVRLMRNSSDDENRKLHNSSNSSSLNNMNRKRTWATVYFVNTLLCARMGRSPVIRANDWPIPQINTDSWEEWLPWECYYGSNIMKVENGKFLSTFNEVMKGMFIVNLAITSTIDTSKTDSGEIRYDDRQNSHSMTLRMFESLIDSWIGQLPDHCKEEYFRNSIPVPTVMLIHLLKNLIWIILAVRLSSLKNTCEIKDSIIKFRNQKYTSSIIAMKKFINHETLEILHRNCLFDYFLIMTFSFPEMMVFESEFIKQAFIDEMKGVLIRASKISIPCRICYDLYRITTSAASTPDDGKNNATTETPKAHESPQISNLINLTKNGESNSVDHSGKQQADMNSAPSPFSSMTNGKSWLNQLPPPTATTFSVPPAPQPQGHVYPGHQDPGMVQQGHSQIPPQNSMPLPIPLPPQVQYPPPPSLVSHPPPPPPPPHAQQFFHPPQKTYQDIPGQQVIKIEATDGQPNGQKMTNNNNY
ncbi:atrR ABC-transporter-regulating transcription factor [Candida maltosa Xu316]